MLTRELLLFRVRDGRLRPSFVRTQEPGLRALTGELIAEVEAGHGRSRDEVEEALELRAGAYARPKVARGLVKLLVDRMDFDEPSEGLAQARALAFHQAARVLRSLPAGATVEDYEARLAQALPRPLPEVRESLYADLPGRRRLRGWEALGPVALLERYNLALAQGHLLDARRLTLRARAPELSRVRKVLRWLRFCRLVAEARRDGDDWTLEVEGPGAMLSLPKKYGLQLASFLTVVPVLERWELTAWVESARRRAVLVLDETAPLVSPHAGALGHVPPEVASLAGSFADAEWEVDSLPLPRHVGAAGLCVPDLTFRHRRTGREVALELFHAWHAAPLARRLEELRSRPDEGLLLGVDRSLAKEPGLREQLEAHPQVVLFHGFPSAKRLRARLSS
jgi:uncharacterized protein